MIRVLIVCTGNTCRSAMAEGIFARLIREKFVDKVKVMSAGTSTVDGYPASPEGVRVLQDFDIDISNHRSQLMREEMLRASDLVLVMEDYHRERAISLSPPDREKIHLLSEFGPKNVPREIPDPLGAPEEVFRDCALTMFECLKGVLIHLEKMIEEQGNYIAIGSDHRGLGLKKKMIPLLEKEGYKVEDVGCYSEESADYSDFALQVGERVGRGRAGKGVVICGSGIGVSIAANKVPGVRAALCTNVKMVELSRLHNDANILCLGADFIPEEMLGDIVKTWLNTEFEGDRHKRRLRKISDYEENIRR